MSACFGLRSFDEASMQAPLALHRPVAVDPVKVVRLMLAFFGDSEVPQASSQAPDDLPQPHRQLLVHNGHMTEVLTKHHGAALTVRPYRIQRAGDLYGRRLDLFAGTEDRPVMTGVMIFNLALVAPTVSDEIVAAQSPLGEILIRHRILRRVAADAFLRFAADDPLTARFQCAEPRPAYGRLATIVCDQQPAVDLLEIVRP
jgi:chorismate-pyruvate lyase